MPSNEQITLLKGFIELCKANPDILHQPALKFYRDYLESLGAKIPDMTQSTESDKSSSHGKCGHGDGHHDHHHHHDTGAEAKAEEPMEDDDDEEPIPMPELDLSGVIDAETDAAGAEPSMGDASVDEVSEEKSDASDEKRSAAMSAFSEGNFDEALTHYTEAIELNPLSAVLFAKRANVLLKLKRPMAAIRDCAKAISLNPDSAQAYKFRGRAYQLLGRWEEAYTDLATACKIDYDDTANEWANEVKENAKKMQEYHRAIERRREEKQLNARRERVRRAQEENERARKAEEERRKKGGDDEDFGDFDGGAPPGMGGMGGMADLFGDPEIGALFKDEEAMAAFADITQNPANIEKHKDNPKVMKLIQLLQKKSGGLGGMFGGMPPGGGMPGEPTSAPAGDAPPAKAPEPDVD